MDESMEIKFSENRRTQPMIDKVQKYGEKRISGQIRWYKVFRIDEATFRFRHTMKQKRSDGAFGQSVGQKEYAQRLRAKTSKSA